MAKKQTHPNKKIIILSILLLSLLFGLWAVNYKTGIFNLQEKAGGSRQCVTYGRLCDNNSKLCCQGLKCNKGECISQSCQPEQTGCFGQEARNCLRGYVHTINCKSDEKCADLGEKKFGCEKKIFTCKDSCVTSNTCSANDGSVVTGTCSFGKVCCKFEESEPLPTDDPTPTCNYECVSSSQCNMYGQKMPGTCTGGVCCDL